jgi:hypothetical protein
MKTIQQKTGNNQLIIIKADKGNTLIIMYKDDYNRKIEEFIKATIFIKLPHKQQIKTWKGINKFGNIIKKNNKWKYVNMNPSAPRLQGTVKLRKQDKPIRSIVNWRNCPAYKVANI